MTLNFRHFAAAAFSLLAAPTAIADVWTVDPAQSTLAFEVQQGGAALTGIFGTWSAAIDFDPDAPEKAQISANIRPASATTGNAQFDGTLPNADWFDVASFPEAKFIASNVERVEGNSYRATGTLDIKGLSHPIILDFSLDIDGDIAKATGTATLNRLDYKLGSAVATDTVGDAVTVTLDLTASR
ncbi:YceI family protein [Roseibium sp.]|uniref:YceI family protein n=1 Tax=Roseibium sp. TaxID=1936156 RepID=UPI003B52FBEA